MTTSARGASEPRASACPRSAPGGGALAVIARGVALALLLGLTACDEGDTSTDASVRDASTDAAAADASAPRDAGVDAGAPDGSTPDGGPGDAGASDGGIGDAGASDGGPGDAGPGDGSAGDGGADDGGADDGGAGDGGAGAPACADATLTLGVTVTATTVGAGDDHDSSGEVCAFPRAVSGPDLVYHFVAPAAATYRVRVVPETTSYDVLLYVRSACEASACLEGANLNDAGDPESVTLPLGAGEDILIFVDTDITSPGSSVTGGTFQITVTED